MPSAASVQPYPIGHYCHGPGHELYVGDSAGICHRPAVERQQVWAAPQMRGVVVAVGLLLAVLLDYLAAGDALEDATCRGCFYFPTCGGGCPYERIHNQHHPEQPADPCPHILGNLDAFMEAHIALRGLEFKHE